MPIITSQQTAINATTAADVKKTQSVQGSRPIKSSVKLNARKEDTFATRMPSSGRNIITTGGK